MSSSARLGRALGSANRGEDVGVDMNCSPELSQLLQAVLAAAQSIALDALLQPGNRPKGEQVSMTAELCVDGSSLFTPVQPAWARPDVKPKEGDELFRSNSDLALKPKSKGVLERRPELPKPKAKAPSNSGLAAKCFALVAELPCAMATDAGKFWKDDEIIVDKDGIPHYTGLRPELMREYRKRVLFAFSMLEGDGDTPEKEARDLEKKKRRFAKRLMDALHGEAWRCCQDLLMDMDTLQKPDGYKAIFKALQTIEKVTVVRKTEEFDKFFERGFRRRGQALDTYLRSRRQDWHELQELDDQTSMSPDLLAYFILKQCNLSKEDRRQILLANNSSYDLDGIERAMRVSFFDIHEREKVMKPSWDARSKGQGKRKQYAHMADEYDILKDDPIEEFDDDPENEDALEYANQVEDEPEIEFDDGEPDLQSDAGASNDEEIFNAYTTMDKQRRSYKDSRKRLREIQKNRGFYKQGDPSERAAAIEKEKARTRCSACDRIGHWAGDPVCPKAGKGGPKRGKGSSRKGGGKGGKKARAYLASEEPLFFVLDDSEEEAQAYMVKDDSEKNEMEQDAGWTELDGRRKVASSAASQSSEGWSKVEGYASLGNDAPPWRPDHTFSSPATSTVEKDTLFLPVNPPLQRQMPVIVKEAGVYIIQVKDRAILRPELDEMTHRQLQEELNKYDLRVSGNKAELRSRMESFFNGEPVHRKGCSRQFIMLEELDPSAPAPKAMPQSLKQSIPAKKKESAKASSSTVEHARFVREVEDPSERDSRRQQPRLRRRHHHLQHQVAFRCRLARFYLVCLVKFAVQTCVSVRTAQSSTSSSAARPMDAQDADSPTPTMRDWQRPTWLAASAACEQLEGEMVQENSGNEPNDAANEVDNANMKSMNNAGLFFDESFAEEATAKDERRVCLLDTACTSCMHSKAWREAYTKHLPGDLVCEPTDETKTFHFADGGSTDGKINVWKIPLVIGGRRGMVFSAEVPTGSTPLLLSIAAMEALGMTLFMKERMVLIGALDVKVPMLKTRTKHLALDVTGSVSVDSHEREAPLCQSHNNDLYLYLVEEASYQIGEGQFFETLPDFPVKMSSEHEFALKLGPRGVFPQDHRGELKPRRHEELERSSKQLRNLDRRTWTALKHRYTYAEEAASHQFQTTMIFEPFGGTFGITRAATRSYGWTCSQPLDILDGYDLLSSKGERLLWRTLDERNPYLTVLAFDCRLWSLLNNLTSKAQTREQLQQLREGVGRKTLLLVYRVCKHRFKRGRYYLIENPAGSLAWMFDELLPRLLHECEGKYIVSDQCAYGKIDLESLRPVKKPTGWLSNNEPLLNALGKRCKCKWGSHQLTLGRNSYGPRARQASAYPPKLCLAVCQGVLNSMKIDYAHRAAFDLSYPALDEDMEEQAEEPDIEVVGDEPAGDAWEKGEGKIVRVHLFPRTKLFSPMSTDDLPCDFRQLLPQRVTYLEFEDGATEVYCDDWVDLNGPYKDGRPWRGKTEISIQPLEEDAEPDAVEQNIPSAEAMDNAKEWLVERGGTDWQLIPLEEELGKMWASQESANADVEQPDADDPRAREREDMSSGSTSMARMRYESERDAKKARRDSEFFAKKERERKQAREERSRRILLEEQQRAAAAPIPEYDPELDDYHQSSPSKRLPVVAESPEVETQEREAKRLRGDDIDATAEGEGLFCYLVIEQPRLLKRKAKAAYFAKELEYALLGISYDDFMFGFRRNRFDRHYEEMYDFAMNATPGTAAGKKRGRKEILLRELPEELSKLFTDDGESDEKEWRAWQEKGAVDVLDETSSREIRRLKPDLIVPTRREIKQHESGHIDIAMRNYSLNTKKISISNVRKAQVESSLTESEMKDFLTGAGELGWLTRQLRCDLGYENGVVQRSKTDACVGDLTKLKQYLSMARRGADFRMRYWSDVDLRNGVLVHLADSGHANGAPEKDEIMRYRSVGGYFLLIANPEKLKLEALSGELNLKDWPAVIQRRKRVYVTDARSVYDCLQKDATSTSTDKRMALEGALLREIVRQPQAFVRWIDGMQNVANVLTKSGAEKDTLREFLREGMMSLVQSEANKKIKEKKGADRHRRSVELDKPTKKREANVQRRRKLAEELQGVDVSSEALKPNRGQGVPEDHKKVPLAVPLVRAFRDPALEVRVMELPPKMLGAAEVCGENYAISEYGGDSEGHLNILEVDGQEAPRTASGIQWRLAKGSADTERDPHLQAAVPAQYDAAFLKERGNVDAYPSVEVTWQRGHDPELELWACNGSPPSSMAKSNLEPSARIALSPYQTAELHFLLQCHGIQPVPGSPAPRVPTGEDACERIANISAWQPWHWLSATAAVVIPLILVYRCCCHGVRRHKAKLDDGADELGAAI
ncbi:unnamed protein product [Durusdinium trenchii]|uniref:SAP domain-containing protein n=1 Tax=Durusdinium trenchii TaxID=1381693 RepID=A0ABP0NH96_9DINO